MGDGSMQYAITALWTASQYQIPVTIVVASNAEYGVVKEFGVWEKTPGVPGLDLPGLNIVATAASYGVDAHEAHTTDEVVELVKDGIADRRSPHPHQRTHHCGRHLKARNPLRRNELPLTRRS